MKINLPLCGYHRLPALLGLILMVLLQACSKKTDNDITPIITSKKNTIQLQVGGIKVNNDPKIKLANSFNLHPNVDNLDGPIVDVKASGSGDFLVHSIASQNQTHRDIVRKSVLNRSMEKTAYDFDDERSYTQMDTLVKYRFLLFDNNTGKLIDSYLLTAGKVVDIAVDSGANLRWSAYSYNDQADIPKADNFLVTNAVDKPFLYASGQLVVEGGKNLLPILFEHQLTQLEFRINTRRYFGDIINIETVFNDDCIKVVDFDVRAGEPTVNLRAVDVGAMKFIEDDQGSRREEISRYYTADNSLTSYQVKVNVLDIQNPNRPVESLVSKLPTQGVVTFNNFTGNNKCNVLKGLLKLWKVLPQKTIMHYGTLATDRGYEAVAGSTSGYFLASEYNFSPASNYLKIKGFAHVNVNSGGTGSLAKALEDPSKYPNILLCVFFGTMNDADFTALELYLQRGGVTFLMTESNNTALKNFFQRLLGMAVTINTFDSGGAVYRLQNVDPNVTDGAFGDIRGTYWGQDRSASQYFSNINQEDIVIYTNSSANYNPQVGTTMFRHKIYNLYYVGDTGFLASTRKALGGAVINNTGFPFATVGGTGADIYFPVSKAYGTAATPLSPDSGRPAGSWQVSNSLIFANALSWMLERAQYAPVNRNP